MHLCSYMLGILDRNRATVMTWIEKDTFFCKCCSGCVPRHMPHLVIHGRPKKQPFDINKTPWTPTTGLTVGGFMATEGRPQLNSDQPCPFQAPNANEWRAAPTILALTPVYHLALWSQTNRELMRRSDCYFPGQSPLWGGGAGLKCVVPI